MARSHQTRKTLPLALVCTAIIVGLSAFLEGQPKPEQPAAKPQATTPPPATTQPAATTGAAASRSSSRPADPEPRREPTPSEILQQLIKKDNAPPKPVVRPVQRGQERVTVDPSALPANAVVPVTPRLMPDGYRIVDRPGRLTREGDYWIFAFESRSQGAAELPIRLLPNRLLEDMEMASSAGTKEIVFVVSGEVTEYHGVNYLLIQKLLTRPDLGNFK